MTFTAAAAGGTPAIVVEELVKRYKGADRNAVDGISFSVGSGEFFTLLGPNGAGKTTTISILTTTLLPTQGTARIAGHDVRADPSSVRSCAGIIFQRPSLDQNLSGEENVRFHTVLYGLYPWRPSYGLMPRAYKRRVHELTALLGVEAEIFRPVSTYSGGMRRKLEIVRSLMHDPAVLFLDEPTSGLDAASRRALWDYLRQVRRSGTTIFLTTHYLEEAEDADRVCIIDRGRVVSLGTPAAVKADLTDEHLVLDAADHDALRVELRRRGVAFEETPRVGAPAAAGRFKVRISAGEAHALLRSIETPLTLIRTHAPTLEDAYLRLVGQAVEETDVAAQPEQTR